MTAPAICMVYAYEQLARDSTPDKDGYVLSEEERTEYLALCEQAHCVPNPAVIQKKVL